MASLDKGQPIRVTPASSQALYAAGQLLFVEHEHATLVAQTFDVDRGTLSGDLLTLAEEPIADPNFTYADMPGVVLGYVPSKGFPYICTKTS
jgi:hypothetical protein